MHSDLNGMCAGGNKTDPAHWALGPSKKQHTNQELPLPARNERVKAVLWLGKSLAWSKKDGQQKENNVLLYMGQSSFFEEKKAVL